MAVEDKLQAIVEKIGSINATLSGTLDTTIHNVPPNMQTITATVNGTVTPGEGYQGIEKVIVAVPNSTEERTFNTNGEYYPTSPNIGFSKVIVNVTNWNLQAKSISKSEITDTTVIECDPGYDGLSSVTINID